MESDGVVEQDIPPIIHLKFWCVSPEGEAVLHTRIDQPHSSLITGVTHDPNSHAVVTCSIDQKFRVWKNVPLQREENPPSGTQQVRVALCPPSPLRSQRSPTDPSLLSQDGPSPQAHCVAVLRRGAFLQYEARAVAFAPDSSLVAVAFHQVVTLWSLSALSLLRTLSSPPPLETVSFLFFAPSRPFLAVCTNSHVYVWNLLSLTVWWSVRMEAAAFAVDRRRSRFAVVCSKGSRWGCCVSHSPPIASQKTLISVPAGMFVVQEVTSHVLMFSFESPRPLAIWKSSLLSDICFVKTKCEEDPQKGTCLVGILSAGNTVLFGEEGREVCSVRGEGAAEGAEHSGLLSQRPRSTRFSDLYGGCDVKWEEERAGTSEKAQERRVPYSQAAAPLFAAPSHLLPSVSDLYASFADRILKRGMRRGEGEEEEERGVEGPVRERREKREAAPHSTGDHLVWLFLTPSVLLFF